MISCNIQHSTLPSEINMRNWLYGFRKHEDLGLMMNSYSECTVFALQSMYGLFHWNLQLYKDKLWCTLSLLAQSPHWTVLPTADHQSQDQSLGNTTHFVDAPTSETDSMPLTKWEARKFKKLNILLLQSQYILSLVIFVIKNKNTFAANYEIHSS